MERDEIRTIRERITGNFLFAVEFVGQELGKEEKVCISSRFPRSEPSRKSWAEEKRNEYLGMKVF